MLSCIELWNMLLFIINILQIFGILEFEENILLSFCNIIFCQFIPPSWYIKNISEMRKAWISWFLLSTYKHGK